MTTPFPRPPASYPQPAPPTPSYPRPAGDAPSYPQTEPEDGGGSRIEAALRALAEVKDAPPADQVAPLTQAHRVLRETLESIGDV